ncbi:MAG TPA: hypothetical protein VNZ06_06445 [Steroidobacteraceae bacterium]|jgi:hypothetical protein|nr:hypothetical protein [Steroidobacteraceae bacterium]
MLIVPSVRSVAAAITAVVALAACASSHVLVGAPRPPISPDQVTIYTNPPAQYEQIAILNTSSRGSFALTAQGKTDKVIQRLKDEAAKLGANGVLLQGIGDRQSGSIGSGFGGGSGNVGVGFGTSVGTYQKTGNGVAIYVGPAH